MIRNPVTKYGDVVLTFQIKMAAALTRNLTIALDLASLAFVAGRNKPSQPLYLGKSQALRTNPILGI